MWPLMEKRNHEVDVSPRDGKASTLPGNVKPLIWLLSDGGVIMKEYILTVTVDYVGELGDCI